jgi:hypothetical protein
MHFSLVRISPPGVPTAHGFDDAILPLFYAFKSLGFAVEILCNRANPQSRNIVFGSCQAPRKTGRMLPRGSIIFNLEQLVDGSLWMNRDYLAHLRDFAVWDYSPGNIARLNGLGIRGASCVPPGYVPEMTRIDRRGPQDVDVLFYGLINARRQAVITRLRAGGIRVLAARDLFGNRRDALLARSRLLLNIHYAVPAKLEMVRLGYAFANRIAVIAEERADTELPANLERACAFFPEEALPEGARRLLDDDSLREKQEAAAFAAFSALPLAATLEKLVGRRVFASAPQAAAGGEDDGSPLAGRGDAPCAPAPPEWLIAGGGQDPALP